MKKLMIGTFPDATSAILAAVMMGGMDGGTMLGMIPTYRDAEGDARLAEAERLTTELLGPAPERPWLPKPKVKQDLASQADLDALRQKAAGSAALANRKRAERRRKHKR